jgi:solute carrier family 25 (mitochondrial carnitine/acylcarnitine transporter), member 20/29
MTKNNETSSFFSLQTVNFGEEALGGLAAGIVGTVIGFPLDLIKTRLQTGSGTGAGGAGMIHVASHIIRTEGIRSLYKGIAPPLLSLSIINTVSFTSYSYFRNLYGGTNGWDTTNSWAGMTGAPLFGMITTPENFLKTQMQLDNVTRQRFRGSFHGASLLIQEHGFRVLYTGHTVNTVREGAFMACYFYIYEGFREILMDYMGGKVAVPLSGGLAGASAWFFSFPLDCIRAGVQGQDMSNPVKRGAVRVFFDLLNTKGVIGLYSGVGPSIARAFLVSGSRFSAYEGALWLLRGGRDNK